MYRTGTRRFGSTLHAKRTTHMTIQRKLPVKDWKPPMYTVTSVRGSFEVFKQGQWYTQQVNTAPAFTPLCCFLPQPFCDWLNLGGELGRRISNILSNLGSKVRPGALWLAQTDMNLRHFCGLAHLDCSYCSYTETFSVLLKSFQELGSDRHMKRYCMCKSRVLVSQQELPTTSHKNAARAA